MVNWYEIEVEQKLAQERYETIIRSRQGIQRRESNISLENLADIVPRGRSWLGDQLIALGCQLKPECRPA